MNLKIIESLLSRRDEELAAIIQYESHLSTARFWKYSKLIPYIEEILSDERKHYSLIENRLRDFGIIPVAASPTSVNIGQDIPAMHRNDRDAEDAAIVNYNTTLQLCFSEGDAGTWLIISDILRDEEDHKREWMGRLASLDQMGESNYLSALL